MKFIFVLRINIYGNVLCIPDHFDCLDTKQSESADENNIQSVQIQHVRLLTDHAILQGKLGRKHGHLIYAYEDFPVNSLNILPTFHLETEGITHESELKWNLFHDSEKKILHIWVYTDQTTVLHPYLLLNDIRYYFPTAALYSDYQ